MDCWISGGFTQCWHICCGFLQFLPTDKCLAGCNRTKFEFFSLRLGQQYCSQVIYISPTSFNLNSTVYGGNGSSALTINSGAVSNETSDCDVSEVRIFDYWMSNWGVGNINAQLMASSTVGKLTLWHVALTSIDAFLQLAH